jgi:histidyl-tRNA synthetase
MFRREKPQRGRYRQFNQFGVEMLGFSEPQADADLIEMAYSCLVKLGLDESAVQLQLNSLGDEASMQHYLVQLHEYLQAHRDSLSAYSATKLELGGSALLKVLESQIPQDVALLGQGIPLLHDSLTSEAAERFDAVRSSLDNRNVPYVLNPLLVRGLDYYSHTVFEFIDLSMGEKRQSAVLAGGRYDGLASTMTGDGKAVVPALGWAAGVDRVALCVEQVTGKPAASDKQPDKIGVVVIRRQGQASADCLNVAETLVSHLRATDRAWSVHYQYAGSTKAQFKHMDSLGVTWVAVVGEAEAAASAFTVKHMPTRKELTGLSFQGVAEVGLESDSI